MKHLGDITKINGAEIEKVDCITFGSPCQDVSVAGTRSQMKHEAMGDEETTRSGLFYEAIRIIKEMREDDIRNGNTDYAVRPRYGVLENVPGLLSSNKGEDFRCVLEAFAKIIQEDAVIPRLEDGQKWSPSGSIVLDGGSICWKQHNASEWGVPQRRKRLCVLADFNGFTAEQILFAPEYRRIPNGRDADISFRYSRRGVRSEVQPVESRLSGHTDSCESERKETTGDTSKGT